MKKYMPQDFSPKVRKSYVRIFRPTYVKKHLIRQTKIKKDTISQIFNKQMFFCLIPQKNVSFT